MIWERQIGEGYSDLIRHSIYLSNDRYNKVTFIGSRGHPFGDNEGKDTYISIAYWREPDGYALTLSVIDDSGTQGMLADWLDENRPEAGYLANCLRRTL